MARKGRVRTRRQRVARRDTRTDVLRLPRIHELPQTAIRRSTVRLSRADTPFAGVKVFPASPARQRVKERSIALLANLGFVDVRKARVCARRTVRKQVIHALGVAGARGIKRRRNTLDSTISCA